MAQPLIGSIAHFGGNFAPQGYAFCNGSLQAIAQNETLFGLIGTTYGGDGQTTFALPDLRGRVPIGSGQGPGLTFRTVGQNGGAESVTLTTTSLPAHIHPATFSGAGSSVQATPVKATLQQPVATASLGRSVDSAGTALPLIYAPAGTPAGVPLGGMNVAGTVAVSPAGGSQPHDNIMPTLVVSAIIALNGIFPSRN